MTSLISWLTPTGVAVMTDTLLTVEDTGKRAGFVAKAYPVPQINALISGRGSSDLIAGWAFDVACRTLVADFDMLVDLAPPALAARWADLAGQRPETSSVFAWGWSPVEGRFTGYAFRSGSGFMPERLEDGIRCAPGLADESRAQEIMRQENQLAAMRDLMIAAAEEGRAGPVGDRCEIGGEIILYRMGETPEGAVTITSEIVHYFPDRDLDYALALETLHGG